MSRLTHAQVCSCLISRLTGQVVAALLGVGEDTYLDTLTEARGQMKVKSDTPVET